MTVYHDRGCPQLLQVLPGDFGNQRSTSVGIYTGGCRGFVVSIVGSLHLRGSIKFECKDALNRLLIRIFVITLQRPFGPTSTDYFLSGMSVSCPCRNLGPSARDLLK